MKARFYLVAAQIAGKPAEIALRCDDVVLLEAEVLFHAALRAAFLAVETVLDAALLASITAVIWNADSVYLGFLDFQIFLN